MHILRGGKRAAKGVTGRNNVDRRFRHQIFLVQWLFYAFFEMDVSGQYTVEGRSIPLTPHHAPVFIYCLLNATLPIEAQLLKHDYRKELHLLYIPL